MLRLRHVIALMTHAVLVGSLLVLMLAQGHYSLVPVAGAILLGTGLTWPVAVLITRWIKLCDPLWDITADRPTPEALRQRARRPAWTRR